MLMSVFVQNIVDMIVDYALWVAVLKKEFKIVFQSIFDQINNNDNKFPLCILFLTLIYNINIIHVGVTLAELRLLGKKTRHSQVGYIGHRCGRLF